MKPEAEQAYQQWRAWKIAGYPKMPSELLVSVNNPFELSEKEKLDIRKSFIRSNMVIYSINNRSDFTDKGNPISHI